MATPTLARPSLASADLQNPRYPASAIPITDATPRQVVGAHLDAHPIAQQDADAELAHLAPGIGQQLVPIVELDLELGVGHGVDHRPIHFDRVVLRQRPNSSPRCALAGSLWGRQLLAIAAASGSR